MRQSNLKIAALCVFWIASLLLAMTVGVLSGYAQDDDFKERLALAQKMVDINPPQSQVENAIDSYISNYLFALPEQEQADFRKVMLSVMNPKALEKTATDAYAEIFTLDELEAMAAYYSLPEAQSAGAKQKQLNDRIAPEIVKMLDQALILLKTGQKTP